MTHVGKGIERLLTAYQEGLLSLEQLRERMPALRHRQQTISAELQAIADQTNDRTAFLRLAETLTVFLARLRIAAETLSVLERQKIVRLLVKDVLVGEDTITVRHRIPIPSGPLQNGGSESNGQNYLLCKGRDNSPLWEDEWSVKDADLLSFREILDFRDARGFFGNWFTWKLLDANNQTSLMNSFEVRRVTPEDISDEVLLAETKRLKIEASPAQLKREMLNERALRIFVYRASRREDVRSSRLYSKSAKSHAVRYGFPD